MSGAGVEGPIERAEIDVPGEAGAPGLSHSLGALARRVLLSVSYAETRLDRRGFVLPDRELRQRLESVGRAFLDGYHLALGPSTGVRLADNLRAASTRELEGFVFEGAGMGLALRDALAVGSSRLRTFLEGPGRAHCYMIHVGAGWALARARPLVRRILDPLPEPLSWLSFDGYGFHEGYFDRRKWGSRKRPGWLRGYELRAFDQGLGRSLWFSQGASARRIAQRITRFDLSRHGDLWSGVGLAATYAGGVDESELSKLLEASGPSRRHLGQGAVFAAKARVRAGNRAPHNDLGCGIFLGRTAPEAAAISDAALENLPRVGRERPSYEVWRHRIRGRIPPQ